MGDIWEDPPRPIRGIIIIVGIQEDPNISPIIPYNYFCRVGGPLTGHIRYCGRRGPSSHSHFPRHWRKAGTNAPAPISQSLFLGSAAGFRGFRDSARNPERYQRMRYQNLFMGNLDHEEPDTRKSQLMRNSNLSQNLYG